MIKIGNSASHISVYTCHPTTKKELRNIVEERIAKEGRHCDLNDIDVSEVTDMSNLFSFSVFDGDISNWDVSNVEHMSNMFSNCEFNGDISKWDVRNVKRMGGMFTKSIFNQDISNWKINKDCDTGYMFSTCNIKEEYKPKSLQGHDQDW